MRERRKHSKNTWRGIALALLLGFITTIVLAQLIALFGSIDGCSIPDQPPEYGANHAPKYMGDIVPPLRIVEWQAMVENPKGYMYDYLNIGRDIVDYSYGEQFAVWDRAVHGDIPPAAYITRCFVGLPFRCMYYDNFSVANGGKGYTLTYFGLMKERAGFRAGLRSPGPTSFWNERRIPLAPMWSGLIANSVFFGLCWYLPGTIHRQIRHRRLMRQDLCLTCGYAVEDLEVCPECGSVSQHRVENLET